MHKNPVFIGFVGGLALFATLTGSAMAAPAIDGGNTDPVNPSDYEYCYPAADAPGGYVCEGPLPTTPGNTVDVPVDAPSDDYLCEMYPEEFNCDTPPTDYPEVSDYNDYEAVIASGDSQSIAIGAISAPLMVRVTDMAGQAVPNANVSWELSPPEAGVLEEYNSVTNSDGFAQATVTRLGSGEITVTASVSVAVVDSVPTPPKTVQFKLLSKSKGKIASVDGNSDFLDEYNTALENIAGLDANRQAMATLMFQACINLEENQPSEVSDEFAAAIDLQNRCGTYRQALNPDSENNNAEQDYNDAVEGLGIMIPQATAAQSLVSIGDQQSQLNNIGQRLGALRQGGRGLSLSGLNIQLHGQQVPVTALQSLLGAKQAAPEAANSRWGAFVDGAITRGEKDSDDLEAGFDNDGVELTAGVDYRLTAQTLVGAALGYSDSSTEFEDDLGSIDTTGYQLSMYATYYQTERFYMDAILSFGANQHESVETMITTVNGDSVDIEFNGDTDGTMTSFSLGGGYNYALGGWTLSPYGRMEYSLATIDEYTQKPSDSGAGIGNALTIHEHEAESITSNLGAQVTYAISTRSAVIVPQLRLDYEHQFNDDVRIADVNLAVDPEAFDQPIVSEQPDTDYMNLLLGATAVLPGGQTGYAYYKAPLGISSYNSSTLGLGYRLEF